MKTFITFFLVIAGCLMAVLSLPHGIAQGGTPVMPLAPGTPSPTAGDPVVTVASWETIKDYAYPQHPDFVTVVGIMLEKVDAEILEQKAIRDTLTESAAKDWDIAIKDLEEARSLVQSRVTELGKAKPEMWEDAKEQVGIAWQRVQNALDKVRASTTS